MSTDSRSKSHGINAGPSMCPLTDRACTLGSMCIHQCMHRPVPVDPTPEVCCGEPEACLQQDIVCIHREKSEKARFAMQSVAPTKSQSAARKASPVFSGVLNYFPDALMAVARVSKAGNDKHNPGQPLHWSRGKSNDHMDCAARHMLTPYEIDPDSKEVHLANAVWRLLAELQLYQEKQRAR